MSDKCCGTCRHRAPAEPGQLSDCTVMVAPVELPYSVGIDFRDGGTWFPLGPITLVRLPTRAKDGQECVAWEAR